MAASVASVPALAPAAIAPAVGVRRALVIGNERYRDNPLSNSVNDARAMAALLQDAGFTVDLRLDATRAAMLEGIDALGAAFAQSAVTTVAFYYAGHAAQLQWRNFLLPVDGAVQSVDDVRRQCVDLGALLQKLTRRDGKTALIFLDACRDDPFGPRFRLATQGMSQYDAPAGCLLAFATAPGRVAIEPQSSNHGLYTEHLVRELSVKGVRLEDALKRVRLNVRLASRGLQVPWESTSLERDVYLYPAQPASDRDIEKQFQEEYAHWQRIAKSTRASDWVEYLRRYPTGKFAEVAQVRLRQLEQPAPAAEPQEAPRGPGLRLGKGHAVPERYRDPANPYSAGTYTVRPAWTVGDEYLLDEVDLFSGVARKHSRLRVERVETQADRVAFSNGMVTDLMGNQVASGRHRRYSVPIQINPEQLQVGRKWGCRFQQIGDVNGEGEYQFRITERKRISVPAGEFSAFRIEGEGWFNGERWVNGRMLNNSRLQVVHWVVPGINVAVRQENPQNVTARVLVSARQAR